MSKKRDEISESAFEYLLCEILELSCDHEEDVGDDKKVLELCFRLLKGIIFASFNISNSQKKAANQKQLDNLGYDVGFRYIACMLLWSYLRFVEMKFGISSSLCVNVYRYVEKLAQNRPLMSDPLDIVKFVCKDFWDDVFTKKVNHSP